MEFNYFNYYFKTPKIQCFLFLVLNLIYENMFGINQLIEDLTQQGNKDSPKKES